MSSHRSELHPRRFPHRSPGLPPRPRLARRGSPLPGPLQTSSGTTTSTRATLYPAYAWAVYVAEVAVDTRTYIAEVTDFHALQEVGKVIHPILAAGQVEGGIAQGIGYALYEKCVYVDGLMRNGQMTNYIMPTSADLPPIHVYFEETPSIHGPGGAKGIGELPMDGPAPAILNAIEHATGIAFTSIPLLPEDIFERMTRTPASGSEDLNPTDRDTRVETQVPA